MFHHLTVPWHDIFSDQFDVLLYDPANPSFESPPPKDESDELRHGSYRDKRSDCTQVVIALIVTPDGFLLAYEVLSRNPTDKTTLK